MMKRIDGVRVFSSDIDSRMLAGWLEHIDETLKKDGLECKTKT